jgi:hypothetical protein
MTKIEAVVHSIAICYPTESLYRQVARWARKHEEFGIESIFDRAVLKVRRLLNGAEVVLVDASDDHAQAMELFSQSLARLGVRRVAVYTERMHEGLELFVRTQGAWLLLGPLQETQWEELFASMLSPAREGPMCRQSPWSKAA